MRKLRVLVALLVLAVASPALAYKIEISEDSNLNIDFLLQFQAVVAKNAAPDKTDWGKDFFVRRSRILLFGDVYKNISFFTETEMANWGKGGDWSVTPATFFVQDAFMTFKVVDEFMVDAGMLILPFTRHSMQSAVSLNLLDYHTAMIKYPDGSQKVWRDAGIQLRGYVFDKKLQYRVGVFNGSKNQVLEKLEDVAADGTKVPLKDAAGTQFTSISNPKDYPRVTGHLRYNILGTETDFFAKGIYAKKPAPPKAVVPPPDGEMAAAPEPPPDPLKDYVLSLGVGVDYQPDACLKTLAIVGDVPVDPKDTTKGTKRGVATKAELEKYLAVAADLFFDIPFLTDHEIIFQSTFVKYWNGSAGTQAKNSGWGLFGELGYRWRWIEPVFGMDYFKSDVANTDFMIVHLGFNGWIVEAKNVAANVKLDVQLRKDGVPDLKVPANAKSMMDADLIPSIFLQAQVYL